jgi:hypothetical protein
MLSVRPAIDCGDRWYAVGKGTVRARGDIPAAGSGPLSMSAQIAIEAFVDFRAAL